MRKIVDLSVPIITGHWRYPNRVEAASSIAKGDVHNIAWFDLQSHQFTHIDAPLHFFEDGKTLDDFPIDLLVGKAAVLDVSYVNENQPIDGTMLSEAFKKCSPADILIVKTSWGAKRVWTSESFWDDSPYITDDGAVFLKSCNPKVVGYDFPQDYDIRRSKIKNIDKHSLKFTTHEILLSQDILMVEYLTNLWDVPRNNVDFIGLPLKREKADGAQIRCIAAFEE